MALRLSDTPPVLDSAGSEDLSLPARRALAAGEIGAYRALFAQASTAEEHNARYWAFCRLIREGLSACASAPIKRLPAMFAAVAAGALQALEAEAREPLLLNWAGVAMYELWALDGASALFGAAHRLDPELASLASNLEALRQRQAQLGRRPAPSLLPEIPALVRHAKRLAARAHPASGMRISLCMIVRDEREMLPRCLSAAAPVVDEIVIVDTGSTDTTIEIARSFGAKVIEREWTGSFAHARNASLQAATGDWLLYLDADEILVSDDAAALRALAGRTWREAFMLREINYTGSGDPASVVTNDALRIVRNRPQYRFQGALHEQIAWSLPTHLPERIESTEIRIEHFGYLDEVRQIRGKTQRNIELLNAEADGRTEGPFLHYNLGCEQLAGGRLERAILEFERAWQLIEQDPAHGQRRWVPTLAIRHVRSLAAVERHQQAAELAESALARFPDFTDLLFEQARSLAALGRHEQALGLCKRCIEMGDARTPYTATAGCGSHLPRMLIAELLEVLLASHNFKSFEQLLPLLEAVSPAQRERREMLAGMYLRQGFPASAAQEWMAVCADSPDARAWIGLAKVARCQQMPAQAIDFAQAALACEPGNDEARQLVSMRG
ncbi:MAG: glycosyltransferase family 2 protein [Solirubrobacteraceae bacterium]